MPSKEEIHNHWRNNALVYQLSIIIGGMVILIGGFFVIVKFLQGSKERGFVAEEKLSEEEILAYSTRPEDQILDQPNDGERLTLEGVIRRALKAHGGVQKLTDIQTLRRSGNVTVYRDGKTETINSTVIYRTPDFIRYLYETKNYTMTAGSNGEDIWRRIESNQGEAQYGRLDGLDRILIEIDLMTLQPFNDALWREGGLTLLPAEEGTGEAPAPYVIERRDGRFIDNMTINAEHFLCTQRDIIYGGIEEGSPRTVTVKYSDYRYVNEVAMPFSIATIVDRSLRSTTQVSEIVLNPGVVSHVFNPPQPLPAETE